MEWNDANMKLNRQFLILFTVICLFGFMKTPDYSILSGYNMNQKKVSQSELPHRLKEVSGITVTDDDRLFVHADENSTIYEIDKSGAIIKQFTAGKNPINADFEDIAAAKGKFYLITSNGYLYRFSEGAHKSSVGYKRYDTGLTTSYDIEGLCYDSETNSLLIACKEYPGQGLKNVRSVYSFSLESFSLIKKPRFLIDLAELKKRFKINSFKPSGIEKHPTTGNFFIISSTETAIVELSPEGALLDAERLSKKTHQQPEGITFLSNRTMLITDEGKKNGTISYYEYNK